MNKKLEISSELVYNNVVTIILKHKILPLNSKFKNSQKKRVAGPRGSIYIFKYIYYCLYRIIASSILQSLTQLYNYLHQVKFLWRIQS
jgi:hypothetical protein